MRHGTLRPVHVARTGVPPLTAPTAFLEAPFRQNVVTLRPTSRGKIIGQHPSIKSVLETIDRVATSMCTVLVTGESGTGKELLIAALHDANRARKGALITINCGAIPSELVESELFGHVKGAFTGAAASRQGHVAAAEDGTLFLDEVGELPLPAQVKLLRLIQQREYTAVGESRATKCDVRIVAATNRNLRAEVAAGRFREDLYYRLNVIELMLPPLRARGADVRALAAHFYCRFVVTSGRTDLRGLSESALAAIEGHGWPGNVRELENAIERGVLLARGPFVEPTDILGAGTAIALESVAAAPLAAVIPFPAAASYRAASNPAFPRVLPDDGVSLLSAVESYQNHLIRQALARTGGNKNRAAQVLGLNRTTLVEIIRRRGL